MRKRLQGLALTTSAVALFAGAVSAQEISGGVVRIGVLTDMSSLYADNTGTGSVLAAQMAIEDFGGTVLGVPVEMVSADHQFRADVAALRSREWFEGGVDMIVDLPGSSTAEASKEVGREMRRITMITGAGSSALTNEGCSPYSVHWTFDTYSNANAIAPVLVERGLDRWFFITADYSFGHALEEDTAAAVTAAGGTVVGSVRHPPNSADYSSFVIQAQASGANIIGLANTGADALNTIIAMQEMGLVDQGMRAALTVGDTLEYRSMGPELGEGLLSVMAAYWNLNEETAAFSDRFRTRQGRPPMSTHLGTYTAVLHYLEAVERAGTDDSDAVMAAMRELPINNMMWSEGEVRIDGRATHEVFVLEGKAEGEMADEWDVADVVATVPGDVAFRPLSDSLCALVTN